MSRNWRLVAGCTILHISSNEILMSCPVVALVAGVKMGSGSWSDSFKPEGKGIPQTLPLVLYSFQPDPDKYPRTTHSTGNISPRITIMERPRIWSVYLAT